MKTLNELIGKKMLLIQPRFFERNYELLLDEELIAGVKVRGIFGKRVEVNGFGGKWEISKASVWSSRLEIREAGKEMPFAFYTGRFFKSDGTIELPRGQKLKTFFGFFRSTYGIKTLSGEKLVLLENKFSLRDKTEITIVKNSDLLEKYPWVILVAWYVAEQRKHHEAG